jgi:methylenetetrahydrofolate reductase (NADPH)
VWVASTLRDTGELMSGAKLQGSPRLLVGAVENPSAPPLEFRAQRFAKKVAAGAEFVQTQYIFDLANFRRFVERAGELGALDHCKLLAGLGPIRSPRALERLSNSIPGVVVSDDVIARFKGVKDEDFAEVGLSLCAEMVAELKEIPGVSGVHLMAFAWEESVPEILSRAGIEARQRRN